VINNPAAITIKKSMTAMIIRFIIDIALLQYLEF
jgi:hypothetical protein